MKINSIFFNRSENTKMYASLLFYAFVRDSIKDKFVNASEKHNMIKEHIEKYYSKEWNNIRNGDYSDIINNKLVINNNSK